MQKFFRLIVAYIEDPVRSGGCFLWLGRIVPGRQNTDWRANAIIIRDITLVEVSFKRFVLLFLLVSVSLSILFSDLVSHASQGFATFQTGGL